MNKVSVFVKIQLVVSLFLDICARHSFSFHAINKINQHFLYIQVEGIIPASVKHEKKYTVNSHLA